MFFNHWMFSVSTSSCGLASMLLIVLFCLMEAFGKLLLFS